MMVYYSSPFFFNSWVFAVIYKTVLWFFLFPYFLWNTILLGNYSKTYCQMGVRVFS